MLDEKNLRNVFHCYYLKNRKHFREFLLHFWDLHKVLSILKKKNHLYKLNISEVIHSEKYGYLNDRKLLFQNTLRESMCSRPLNTAETTMAALLVELSVDPRNIELENISFREF